VRLVSESFDELGEGPCWSPAEGRLYWFDIKGRVLRWLEPSGEAQFIRLPMRASAAAPRVGGGLVIATEAGLAFFDSATAAVELVEPIALPPGFRSNDGKIDPQGRFWWSSMDDDEGRRPGGVFVSEPGKPSRQVLDGVHIANAINVTDDGRTLYLADSAHGRIFAYDLPDMTGRREFARAPKGAAPDGAALDAEGYLWNAEWGGWRIVRYAPDGSVDRIVEAPIEQPSCCVFGGPDLTTLYVTSAWMGLSPQARAAQPTAGCLFAFDAGVRGQHLPMFNG
jgi:sugar lactone lactonase YvrE